MEDEIKGILLNVKSCLTNHEVNNQEINNFTQGKCSQIISALWVLLPGNCYLSDRYWSLVDEPQEMSQRKVNHLAHRDHGTIPSKEGRKIFVYCLWWLSAWDYVLRAGNGKMILEDIYRARQSRTWPLDNVLQENKSTKKQFIAGFHN